jgi:hemerythrin-like domain-containing protein
MMFRWLDHDHNQLSILYEDFDAVARVALEAQDDAHLIEDARVALEDLTAKVLLHYTREEETLFPNVLAYDPSLAPKVRSLIQEHEEVRGALRDLEPVLRGPAEEVLRRRALFEARLERFRRLWTHHSNAEWEVLQEMIQRIDLSLLLTPDRVPSSP